MKSKIHIIIALLISIVILIPTCISEPPGTGVYSYSSEPRPEYSINGPKPPYYFTNGEVKRGPLPAATSITVPLPIITEAKWLLTFNNNYIFECVIYNPVNTAIALKNLTAVMKDENGKVLLYYTPSYRDWTTIPEDGLYISATAPKNFNGTIEICYKDKTIYTTHR